MFVKTSELTRGQRLRIERRRLKQTQVEAASRYKVAVNIYRGWEHDDSVGHPSPNVSLGKLMTYEQCWVLRQRTDKTLEVLSSEIGISRWWLTQMEAGDAPVKRLRIYWATQVA